MAFYLYRQNPANGLWQQNMPYLLLIEAGTSNLADEKLLSIGGYFDTECKCCGPRWSNATLRADVEDGVWPDDKPSIYYDDGRVVQGDGFWVDQGAADAYAADRCISVTGIANGFEVIR